MTSERQRRTEVLSGLNDALRRFSDQDVLFSQAIADRLGINLTDFKCVSIVEQLGPITAGRLAEETGLTTGAITGVIDRLEKARFVRRVKNPEDRRVVIIEAAGERGEDFARLLQPLNRAIAELTAHYDGAELAQILDFFTRATAVLHTQTAILRVGAVAFSTGDVDQPATAPLAKGVTAGRIRFSSGAAGVTIAADPRLAGLYRARFEGKLPTVRVENGSVTIQYPRFSLFDWRKLAAHVTLNATIPWHIELKGGVSKLDADLEGLRLSGLELTGGVSAVSIALPEPAGVVPIRIGGGVSNLALVRPAGVPARIEVRGGVSKLTFDDQKLGSIGGHTSLQSPDFKGAADRYEIEITGGASGLVVTPRSRR